MSCLSMKKGLSTPASSASMKVHRLLALLVAMWAGQSSAQEFNGTLVNGRNRTPVARAKVLLVNGRADVLDSAITDAFGSFLLRAPKDGRFSVIIRRQGYLPVSSEVIELSAVSALVDTVVLDSMAERPVKEAIAASMRRALGSSVSTAFWRYLGPDDIEKVRSRYHTLSELVRVSGKFSGLAQNAPPIGCFYFTTQIACAQLYLNGVAVNMAPDQVLTRDIEAVVALRPDELGVAVAQTRIGDNAQFGAIFVFTSAFVPRQ